MLILTIKNSDKLIGFIILEDVLDKHCFLRNIGIDKTFHGKGLGFALLNKALLMVKEKGCTKCFLWVDEGNIKAINLYKKVGFIQDLNEAEVVFIGK